MYITKWNFSLPFSLLRYNRDGYFGMCICILPGVCVRVYMCVHTYTDRSHINTEGLIGDYIFVMNKENEKYKLRGPFHNPSFRFLFVEPQYAHEIGPQLLFIQLLLFSC